MTINARGPAADTSINGGLDHLAGAFAALATLDDRLADIEFDLAGRNAIAPADTPNAEHLAQLDLLPRMAETVIALAALSAHLRHRLDAISSTLRRPCTPANDVSETSL